MTAVAKSHLLLKEDPDLRRWLIAAAAVVAVHAALIFWILHERDANLAGAPPAAIMIELAPLDVAPPTETPPETTPGPQMTEAEPEVVEEPQTIPVPELPPAQKPPVVLMTPPKPKPKPKKIVKEVPKPAVKPTREPPAPRTTAPPRAAAARAAASRAASSGAAAAAARSACAAGLGSLSKHYPEAARAQHIQGTVRLALSIGRDGRVQSAHIIGSSGSSVLDQAALQMARNANCPAMETSANFVLPVRFSIR